MRIPTLGLGFRSSRLKQQKFYRVASLVLACILSFITRLWTIAHHESTIQDYKSGSKFNEMCVALVFYKITITLVRTILILTIMQQNISASTVSTSF